MDEIRRVGPRWIAVTISVCLVAAGTGLGVYWFTDFGRPAPQDSGLGDGLTIYQAFPPLNATVAELLGGPWLLTSILGIAAEAPVAPLPNYAASLNLTMRLCGELPGVTIWNATGIPAFTGSLESGAAPFWSIIFKNASGSYAYATDIEGAIHVVAPSAELNSCIQAAGIGSDYTLSAFENTPGPAQVAYRATGAVFAFAHSPLVEYYVLGNAQVEEPDASPVGWVINYFRCDLLRVSGIQNYSAVGINESGGKWFVDQGWLSCSLPEYDVDFGQVPTNATGGFGRTTDVSLPFSVAAPRVLANNTTLFDGWGLQAWMTSFNLVTSVGAPLPVAIPSCLTWGPGLISCPAETSGWFVVLQAQTGAWLDSYPSSSSLSAWTIPNVILSSQDRFVLVTPSSWNLSGDQLESEGVALGPSVTGVATF